MISKRCILLILTAAFVECVAGGGVRLHHIAALPAICVAGVAEKPAAPRVPSKRTSQSMETPVARSARQTPKATRMPIGVPAPEFGIEESHWMYADPAHTYDYGSGGEPYRMGANGPYTHYVDRTDPNATDANNPFGTLAKPRLTVPSGPVAAGSVVEIHGRLYADDTFHGEGTSARPVFFRGGSYENKPQFSSEVTLRGKYFVVENIYLYGHHVQIKIRAAGEDTPHHVAVRRCEIAGDGRFDKDGGQAVSIRGSSAHWTRNIVLYNNHIHHHGDSGADTSQDRHSVAVTSYAGDIWILDNDIHHSQGDSVQVRAGTKGDGVNNHLIRRVYIGRNRLHHDRENAVDIKQCSDVIVSQNEMYGYHRRSADGDAVTVHYGPANVWFLFNRIHHCRRGIADSKSNGLYIIGNVFHDIESWAVDLWGGDTKHVIGNTIYRCGGGIAYEFSSSPCHMVNNIIADLLDGGKHIYVEKASSATRSAMGHNLLHQRGGEVVIEWSKDKRYTNLNAFIAATGKGKGCISEDPAFSNPVQFDFALGVGSRAVDAGASVMNYADLFRQLYRLDIRVDFAGTARPQGKANDIGAFEFAGESKSIGNASSVIRKHK